MKVDVMPTHDEAEHFDHKRGALCLIFAGFFFAAMAVFVRLAGDAPTFEKAFFRNLIALFVSGAALRREHVPLKAEPAGPSFCCGSFWEQGPSYVISTPSTT